MKNGIQNWIIYKCLTLEEIPLKNHVNVTLFSGAPVLSQGLQPEQERQLWNEVKHCPYTLVETLPSLKLTNELR